MNVLITGEKGLGMTYAALTNITFIDLLEMHPELVEFRHTCLCGKFKDEKDRDKDYKLPKIKKYCNICREDLEWKLKEV